MIEQLEMPKVEIKEEENYGKFIIEPLERGYGITLGNALRRVLISSLQGTAVTHIKIDGILHEFSTIPGVMEDTTDIILNIKQLRLKLFSDKQKVLRLEAKGETKVKASDILPDSEVEILNPDLVIATLTRKNSRLAMELFVDKGKGYVPYDKQEAKEAAIGLIPIDSIFTPIKRVNYTVEETRVGYQTNYDSLILELWTDGSIKPLESLSLASKALQDYFKHLSNIQFLTGTDQKSTEKDELLSRTIEEMGLSIRSLNCLRRAGIKSLGELMQFTEEDLMRMKNFGQKSLDEIKEKVKSYELEIKERQVNV